MGGRAKGTSILVQNFWRLLCVVDHHETRKWNESLLADAAKTVREFFSPSRRTRSPARICLAICSGIHPEREAKSSSRSPFHSTMLVRSEKDTMICMAIYSGFTSKSFFIAVHFQRTPRRFEKNLVIERIQTIRRYLSFSVKSRTKFPGVVLRILRIACGWKKCLVYPQTWTDNRISSRCERELRQL